MHAFGGRAVTTATSILASWLVRGITYSLPTLLWENVGLRDAVALALALGFLDGCNRLRLARTARSLVAAADALVISSGLDSTRVDWSDVLAVEVWHRLNRVDSTAVHYRTKSGHVVATCWEQGRREELLLFVRQCAAVAKAARPRRTIVRVHLGDRSVYLALLRRLSLDVAAALLVGLLCSNVSHGLWLGAAAALLSASLAATSYLHRAELVLRNGVWWQHHDNGELVRLRVLPKSLRLWASYLSE
jgi:hypothetical protein